MSDDDGQDVRRWLDSALTGEPPLRLDREEVLRRGRRGLRNRRLFQAGGAAAGVVVAVAGTVLLAGLLTGDRSVPPASTGTVTEHPSSATPVSPPSSAEMTTSRPAAPSVSPVDDNAVRLRHTLFESGLLPADAKLVPPPGGTGAPTFLPVRDRVYRLVVDVRAPDGDGWLSVLVEPAGAGGGATCELPDVRFDHCVVREEYGMPMTVAVQKLPGGELRRWVRSVRPDGAFVTAVSSNLSESGRANGVEVSYDKPTALSEKKLIAIAALPELAVS